MINDFSKNTKEEVIDRLLDSLHGVTSELSKDFFMHESHFYYNGGSYRCKLAKSDIFVEETKSMIIIEFF